MNTQLKGGIRIAQFSDLHFSSATLAEVGKCLDSAVTDAIEAKVDVAIFTGDSTDHKQDAHSPALLSLVQQVQRMANHCPVLMLQGTFSHEPAGMLHLFRFIGAKHPIEVADRLGQIGLFGNTWRTVQSAQDLPGSRLLVSCVPTVNKGDLVGAVGAERVAEAMGDALAGLMTGVFSPVNRVARTSGIPTVLIGHGTVNGSVTESGVPMAGLDHEFSTGAIYGAMCSAAMLGHIHRHQVWERDHEGVHQVIAYPGSIGRNHYGEQGNKGFLVWDVTASAAAYQFVVTPSCRMVDFNFTGVPDLEYLRANIDDCRDAFVRVRYEIDAENAASVDRKAIQAVLSVAQEVRIEGRVLPVQRQRCAGISRASSLAEKLTKWCESTGNEAAEIVPRVQMLESSDARTVAANIIKGVFHEANLEVGRIDDGSHGTVAGVAGSVGLDVAVGHISQQGLH